MEGDQQGRKMLVSLPSDLLTPLPSRSRAADGVADPGLKFTEHGLSERDCNDSLTWFTKPNISNLKNNKLLKEIDRHLNRFHKAFKDPKNEHTDEYKHKMMIAQAVSNIEAQRKNIQTYLKNENGVNEPGPTIPDRDAYQRKLDCCILSKIYRDFLTDVTTKDLSKHINRRKKRNKPSLPY